MQQMIKTDVFLFNAMIVLSHKVVETFQERFVPRYWRVKNDELFHPLASLQTTTWTSHILTMCPMQVKKITEVMNK